MTDADRSGVARCASIYAGPMADALKEPMRCSLFVGHDGKHQGEYPSGTQWDDADRSGVEPYYRDDAVTIYHGDCREILPELTADVLVTDPPYGMAHRSGMQGAFGTCEIVGDGDVSLRDEVLEEWGARAALVFGRWSCPRPRRTRTVLTWDKGDLVGMGDLSLPWGPTTEEIYVLGRGFTGKRGRSVLRFQAIGPYQQSRGERLHPTQKPVELLRHLIARCPAGTIADPFMGSGTTLRAAKDLGRKAIGIEIEERYCEIAARRMGQEVLDLAV